MVIAGDCRPVLAYATGTGRLRRAELGYKLDGALASAAVRGWRIDWRAIPCDLNQEAHRLAAAGRAGRASEEIFN
eukprot:10156966-Alexandrium_andersonii.AAC.1